MDFQDLPDRAGQVRLPAGQDQGLPQGCPGPLPGAGARPSPDPEDPDPPEVHPRLVLQKEVPQDEGSCHRHPEELPGLQRQEEVSADEDRYHILCIIFIKR